MEHALAVQVGRDAALSLFVGAPPRRAPPPACLSSRAQDASARWYYRLAACALVLVLAVAIAALSWALIGPSTWRRAREVATDPKTLMRAVSEEGAPGLPPAPKTPRPSLYLRVSREHDPRASREALTRRSRARADLVDARDALGRDHGDVLGLVLPRYQLPGRIRHRRLRPLSRPARRGEYAARGDIPRPWRERERERDGACSARARRLRAA